VVPMNILNILTDTYLKGYTYNGAIYIQGDITSGSVLSIAGGYISTS
jgi:hypothetical protein